MWFGIRLINSQKSFFSYSCSRLYVLIISLLLSFINLITFESSFSIFIIFSTFFFVSLKKYKICSQMFLLLLLFVYPCLNFSFLRMQLRDDALNERLKTNFTYFSFFWNIKILFISKVDSFCLHFYALWVILREQIGWISVQGGVLVGGIIGSPTISKSKSRSTGREWVVCDCVLYIEQY